MFHCRKAWLMCRARSCCALRNRLQNWSVWCFSIHPGISLTKQAFVCGDCAALNIHLGRIFIKAQNGSIVLAMNAPHMGAGPCWTSRAGHCSPAWVSWTLSWSRARRSPTLGTPRHGHPGNCPGLGQHCQSWLGPREGSPGSKIHRKTPMGWDFPALTLSEQR